MVLKFASPGVRHRVLRPRGTVEPATPPAAVRARMSAGGPSWRPGASARLDHHVGDHEREGGDLDLARAEQPCARRAVFPGAPAPRPGLITRSRITSGRRPISILP